MDPFQPAPVEVRKTGSRELQLRADAFQGTSGSLPRLRDQDRIARDQLQRWASRQGLSQHHPRLDALRLGGA